MFFFFAFSALALLFAEFRLMGLVYRLLNVQLGGFLAVIGILMLFLLAFNLGLLLIRRQSQAMMRDLQQRSSDESAAVRGTLVMIAGVLLIIPGFVSDVVALFILFPPTGWLLRKLLARKISQFTAQRAGAFQFSFGGFRNPGPGFGGRAANPRTEDDPTIIDVEYTEGAPKLIRD